MLKDATSRVLCALGIDDLATAFHGRKLLIVTYHGVLGSQLDPRCPWHIEEALFREQMAWLARHRSVLSLDECVRRMRENLPLPDRPAVVTFDDGYRSVLTRGLPVLERLEIPATVFVVTDAIGSGRLLWHDALYLALALTRARVLDLRQEGGACHDLASARLKEEALAAASKLLSALVPADRQDVLRTITGRLGVDPEHRAESEAFTLLSAPEIAEMAAGGTIAFGAHGHSHTTLTLLTEDSARKEVCASVSRVRELTGAKDVPFAYPFGQAEDFDGTVADLARESGATCALTTVPGLNPPSVDPFRLRRIVVGAGLSIGRFRLRVSGLSAWGLRSATDLLLGRLARCRSTLRPVRRFWRTWVYHRETVVVFMRGRDTSHGLPVTPKSTPGPGFCFGQASAGELRRFADRLAPRDEVAFLGRVDERFRDRMGCFVIRRGTGIVASAWVSERPRARIEEIEDTIDIGPDAVYIFDAVTVPDYRGMGLYPHLLDRIARVYDDKTKLVAAARRNVASSRGIERAGFRPLATYKFLKLSGVLLRGRAEGGRASPSTSEASPRPCTPPSPRAS